MRSRLRGRRPSASLARALPGRADRLPPARVRDRAAAGGDEPVRARADRGRPRAGLEPQRARAAARPKTPTSSSPRGRSGSPTPRTGRCSPTAGRQCSTSPAERPRRSAAMKAHASLERLGCRFPRRTPASAARFPDGAEFRIEIPSVEGPRVLAEVIQAAARLEITVNRVLAGQRRDAARRLGDAGDERARRRGLDGGLALRRAARGLRRRRARALGRRLRPLRAGAGRARPRLRGRGRRPRLRGGDPQLPGRRSRPAQPC